MDWKVNMTEADGRLLSQELLIAQGRGDPFAAAIRATRMSMLITDPHQPDNPIVFANDAFIDLTGYDRQDVIGSNCRFLQGPQTDPAAIARIREAILTRRDINIDVLNYRKDGTPFWNALYISPVMNDDGELQFFFASQLDVTDRKHVELRMLEEKNRFEEAVRDRTRELETALEAQTMLLHEVDHRVKNNLQMISSLIILQSRSIPDEQIRLSLRSMLERVEALSTVHRRLYQSKDVTRFDVSQFLRDLVGDLVAAAGRERIRATFDLEPVEVAAERAAPLALMINELVTNAIKHGFSGRDSGELSITVRLDDGKIRLEVADDGAGIGDAAPSDGSGFGLNLVRTLCKQLQAEITWRNAAPGTVVSVVMPVELGKVVR